MSAFPLYSNYKEASRSFNQRPTRSDAQATFTDGREESDSDSDMEEMIRKAEKEYQLFRQHFADILDPELEDEFAEMAKLGLPTVLITSKNSSGFQEGDEGEDNILRVEAKKRKTPNVPDDLESDKIVAEAIESNDDIASVVNNLRAVKLGYAAGWPGPWESVEEPSDGCKDEGVSQDKVGVAQEKQDSTSEEMEQIMEALALKAQAFANQQWQDYWSQNGPTILSSSWSTAYPHIPLHSVAHLCDLEILKPAKESDRGATEPASVGTVGEDSEEVKQLWSDFYNQWYWYTFNWYIQSSTEGISLYRPSISEGAIPDSSEGNPLQVIRTSTQESQEESAEVMVTMETSDMESDRGSYEVYSGWEEEENCDPTDHREDVGEETVGNCDGIHGCPLGSGDEENEDGMLERDDDSDEGDGFDEENIEKGAEKESKELVQRSEDIFFAGGLSGEDSQNMKEGDLHLDEIPLKTTKNDETSLDR